MDNQNQMSVTPIVTPQAVVEQPLPAQAGKQSNFLVILLSILLIISVAISGFFAFQTQKLVKELTLLRTESTPVATTEPTTELVATNSASPDPTANWKTYKSSKYNYTLDLPSDWTIGQELLGGAISKLDSNSKVSSIKFNNSLSNIQVFYEGDFDHGFEPWQFESKKRIKLGGKIAEQITLKLEGNTKKWYIVTVSSIESFRIEANIDQIDESEFDQILSTFKFTN